MTLCNFLRYVLLSFNWVYMFLLIFYFLNNMFDPPSNWSLGIYFSTCLGKKQQLEILSAKIVGNIYRKLCYKQGFLPWNLKENFVVAHRGTEGDIHPGTVPLGGAGGFVWSSGKAVCGCWHASLAVRFWCVSFEWIVKLTRCITVYSLTTLHNVHVYFIYIFAGVVLILDIFSHLLRCCRWISGKIKVFEKITLRFKLNKIFKLN